MREPVDDPCMSVIRRKSNLHRRFAIDRVPMYHRDGPSDPCDEGTEPNGSDGPIEPKHGGKLAYRTDTIV